MKQQSWKGSLKKRMTLENKPLGFVILTYGIVWILSIAFRYWGLPFLSGDMKGNLLGWFEVGKNHGLLVLSQSSNYNAIYLYLMYAFTQLAIPVSPLFLIKCLSGLFDYACAGAIAYVAYQLTPEEGSKRNAAFAGFTLSCLSPIFLLNSAVWGQCDSGYSMFLLLSIYGFIKKRPVWGIVATGLALCLKLQAAFIFPVLGMLYLYQRNFRFSSFLLIPFVLWVSGFGVALHGGSWLFPFTRYLEQTGEFSQYLNLNYGGLFAVVEALGIPSLKRLHLAGVVLAAFVLLGLIYLFRNRRQQLQGKELLRISAWFILVAIFLLPKMHERYAFAAEVLLTAWCVVSARKGVDWAPLLLTWFSSLCTYLIYLLELPSMAVLLVPVNLLALLMLAYPCLGQAYPAWLMRIFSKPRLAE